MTHVQPRMVARRSISLLLAFLTLTMVMLVNAGSALAIEKGNLDQCANGPLATPVQCVTTNWENGNLNASKAHYLEGQSVPYRIGLTDLNVGTSYTVRIEWDTTQGGDHALDYLTSFDRTETTANACTGILTVAQCAAAPTTAAIPVDPNVTKGQDQTLGNSDDIVQVPGQQFKMWGGNLTGTAPNYVLSGTYAGNSATSIDIQFTATGTDAVLAWGGHIASRQDWGAGNSAIAISGSPYHMRLLTLIPPDQGGNQDRSLSTDAVIFPATFNVIKAATPEGSTSFPFTSNFTTSTFNGSFSLVDNGTSTNTKTVSDILTFGTSKSVTEGLVTDWTLDSIACSQINGSTQAVTNFAGNVGTRTAAATINEGDTVTCTFANSRDKGSLEVRKQLSPTTDSGLFNLFIKQGATTIDSQADAGHNGTTGANTVDTGTYQVSETAGTGTNLSDYSAALSCSDQNGSVSSTGGNVTVAKGRNVVCTFTNTRETGSIELRKQLSPSGDPGKFNLAITQGANTIDTEADAGHNGTTGANAVSTGTYHVAETGGTGTTLNDYSAALSCSDQNGTVASTGGNVSVADGRTVVCTFTNTRKTGTLEVRKSLSPTGDPGVFDLVVKQGANTIDSASNQTPNGTPGANTVSTGPYQVSEAAGTNTDLNDYSASLSCLDQNGTVSSTGGNVAVGDGQNVVCTFTNTRETGTIELRKSLSPTDDPGLFDLTIEHGATLVDSATDQTHNGTTGANTVNTGTYDVSEAAGSNTDLDDYQSSLACSDQDGTVSSTGGSVAVGDGKNVVCTFTNTRETGTIQVRKELSPTDDPGLFNLFVKQGATTVESAANQGHNGSTSVKTVNTGTYQVSETGGTATDLDDYQAALECEDEDGTVSSTSGSVAVGAGKDVVCTFTNTRETGTIELRKELSPTDDPGVFDLTIKQGAT